MADSKQGLNCLFTGAIWDLEAPLTHAPRAATASQERSPVKWAGPRGSRGVNAVVILVSSKMFKRQRQLCFPYR